MLPAIDRDPKPEFRSQKQEVLIDGVFFDHVRIAEGAVFLYAQRSPGFSVVGSLVGVGVHIAKSMAIERGIGRSLVEAAGFDGGHPGVLGESGDVSHYVSPRFGAIPCDLQVTVVGPNPNDLTVLR